MYVNANLVILPVCGNMYFMAKSGKITGSTAKNKNGYKVVGQARDGVWIIKPSVRPTHFSQAEAAASVKKVWRDSQTGNLSSAKSK